MAGHKKTPKGIARNVFPKGAKEIYDMTSLPEATNGFQTQPFIFFPLPRTNVGNEFTRTVNRVTCSYFCSLGVLYKAIDRRWLEIVTTLAKTQGHPHIELGGVTSALKRYGMTSQSRYILPTRKALERVASLHVSVRGIGNVKGFKAALGRDFSISKEHQVLWARGRTDLVEPELLDGLNFLELSAEFMEVVSHAVPHIQQHYMDIRSPLTLDLYQWILLKLFNRKDEDIVRWPALYAQFGDGGKLNATQMKNLRRKLKAALYEIKYNYYEAAQIEATPEGIVLKPSPPLVEPDDKRAGYTLA